PVMSPASLMSFATVNRPPRVPRSFTCTDGGAAMTGGVRSAQTLPSANVSNSTLRMSMRPPLPAGVRPSRSSRCQWVGHVGHVTLPGIHACPRALGESCRNRFRIEDAKAAVPHGPQHTVPEILGAVVFYDSHAVGTERVAYEVEVIDGIGDEADLVRS